MNFKNLKAFYDTLTDIKVDKKLCDSLMRYRAEFSNRNDEHILFLGSHLTGVHRISFIYADRGRFFSEIIGIPEADLKAHIESVDSTNTKFVRQSDVFNQSVMYLCHRLMNSKLPNNQRKQAIEDTLFIYHCKLMGSLLAHYFKHPASKPTAEATYHDLTQSFLIKKLKNWGAVLVHRANTMMNSYGKDLQSFNDDKRIYIVITASQDSMRNILGTIYDIHLKNIEQRKTIGTDSIIVQWDDKADLASMTSSAKYVDYADTIVPEVRAFVKPELVDIVCDLVTKVDSNLLIKVLRYISQNYDSNKSDCADLVKGCVIHCINYINTNIKSLDDRSDMVLILGKLKGSYTASKMSDVIVLELRSGFEKLITACTGHKNTYTLASCRTAIMLYIVVRVFSKGSYK